MENFMNSEYFDESSLLLFYESFAEYTRMLKTI